MNVDYSIVIPARMASQRLPGKPLLDVAGKPLIQRVWECACNSAASQVLIATHDEEIARAAEGFGARCEMTRPDHATGSDRIAECLDRLGWPGDSVVVNLQGDEPEMPPECLDQVATLLVQDEGADAATLCQAIDGPEEINDPSVVKAVVSAAGRALYFSRSVVPAPAQWVSLEAALEDGRKWNRHIGLYAYRARALKRIAGLAPSPLERMERLEQLRILESGGAIAIAQAVRHVPAGVDTPADLERVRRAFT